jgi:hypothetical protein
MAVKNVCPETGRFLKQIPPHKKRGLVVHLPPLGGGRIERHWICMEQYLMLLQCQPYTCCC